MKIMFLAGKSKSYTLKLPGIVPEAAGWLTPVFAARSIDASTPPSVSVNW